MMVENWILVRFLVFCWFSMVTHFLVSNFKSVKKVAAAKAGKLRTRRKHDVQHEHPQQQPVSQRSGGSSKPSEICIEDSDTVLLGQDSETSMNVDPMETPRVGPLTPCDASPPPFPQPTPALDLSVAISVADSQSNKQLADSFHIFATLRRCLLIWFQYAQHRGSQRRYFRRWRLFAQRQRPYSPLIQMLVS
jgi:hypothetical protein